MDSSAKRKVGAIALIVAGIGAFLVPFLIHGPALQASSNNGGNNNNNNNGKIPTPTCTTNCSSDTNPTSCTSDPKSTDTSSHSNEGKHLAKGHDKHDTSIVGKAHGFMAAMAKHNPQHDATHSTKTDNDTIKGHGLHSNGQDNDANACADNKDNDDSDDQGNDD
jgi:hypothetical protein